MSEIDLRNERDKLVDEALAHTPKVERYTGRSATLMQAIATARQVRKLTAQKVALLDDLIESLHNEVRKELRKD